MNPLTFSEELLLAAHPPTVDETLQLLLKPETLNSELDKRRRVEYHITLHSEEDVLKIFDTFLTKQGKPVTLLISQVHPDIFINYTPSTAHKSSPFLTMLPPMVGLRTKSEYLWQSMERFGLRRSLLLSTSFPYADFFKKRKGALRELVDFTNQPVYEWKNGLDAVFLNRSLMSVPTGLQKEIRDLYFSTYTTPLLPESVTVRKEAGAVWDIINNFEDLFLKGWGEALVAAPFLDSEMLTQMVRTLGDGLICEPYPIMSTVKERKFFAILTGALTHPNAPPPAAVHDILGKILWWMEDSRVVKQPPAKALDVFLEGVTSLEELAKVRRMVRIKSFVAPHVLRLHPEYSELPTEWVETML